MPFSFKDATGAEWNLDGTAATAIRVREGAGVDLFKLHENNLAPLDALLHDVPKLIHVVFLMCKPGFVPKDLAALQEAWTPEVGDLAADAFIESWVSLQPGKSRRESLRQLIATYRSFANEFAEASVKSLDEATQTALRKLRETPLSELMAGRDITFATSEE